MIVGALSHHMWGVGYAAAVPWAAPALRLAPLTPHPPGISRQAPQDRIQGDLLHVPGAPPVAPTIHGNVKSISNCDTM